MREITCIIMLLLSALVCNASIINVPSDQPTIQAGIDAASDGDTVLIWPGIYSGEGNNNLYTKSKKIKIIGVHGPDSTIIDCEGGRGFSMDWQTEEDSSTVIDGFTFTNASSGLNLFSASPRLNNLKFINNPGSGITNYYDEDKVGEMEFRYSPLFVTNCEFLDNDTGGIYFTEGNFPWLIMEDCIFDNNAIVGLRSPANIKHCSFTNNGIAIGGIEYSYSAIVDSCFFENNGTAVNGAVQITNSTIRNCGFGIAGGSYSILAGHTVDNCLFEGITNRVFFNYDNATISNCIVRNSGWIAYCSGHEADNTYSEFINCEFTNNTGGINGDDYLRLLVLENCLYEGNGEPIRFYNFGSGSIQNCTIVNNNSSAVVFGSLTSGSVNNSIIANNNGIGFSAYEESGNEVTIHCSDVYNNTGGNYENMPDQTGLNGNISEDPLFCDTAAGDYSLYSSSPCAPSNNSCGVLMGAYDVGCGIECGNVNGDDGVEVSDAVYLINYLFVGGPEPYPYLAGDVNCDDKINLVDIIFIVNYVFRGGYSPCDINGDGEPDC